MLRGRGGLLRARDAVGSRLSLCGLSGLLTVLGLRSGVTVLHSSDLTRLAVLGLRSGDAGLTVGVLLGGGTVLAGLTVEAVGRWLAHEHFPRWFVTCAES